MDSQHCKKGEPCCKGVQERLLDAAEELFCEKGFDATSIRELAASADCNVASVNYYFGGKEKLYIEVWRRHLTQMRNSRLGSIDSVMVRDDGDCDLEGLLRSFADGFVGQLADVEKGHRFGKLLAREMIDQHLPGDLFFEELISPTTERMSEALGRVCPELDQSRVPLVVFSFVGQLVHLLHFQAMRDHSGSRKWADFELLEMLDHIVKFSIAGICCYAREDLE